MSKRKDYKIWTQCVTGASRCCDIKCYVTNRPTANRKIVSISYDVLAKDLRKAKQIAARKRVQGESFFSHVMQVQKIKIKKLK